MITFIITANHNQGREDEKLMFMQEHLQRSNFRGG